MVLPQVMCNVKGTLAFLKKTTTAGGEENFPGEKSTNMLACVEKGWSGKRKAITSGEARGKGCENTGSLGSGGRGEGKSCAGWEKKEQHLIKKGEKQSLGEGLKTIILGRKKGEDTLPKGGVKYEEEKTMALQSIGLEFREQSGEGFTS